MMKFMIKLNNDEMIQPCLPGEPYNKKDRTKLSNVYQKDMKQRTFGPLKSPVDFER